jgi:hypothetical protein
MKKQTWICDNCRQEIKEVEHGFVEWLTTPGEDEQRSYGLRLVHNDANSPRRAASKCLYDRSLELIPSKSITCDQPLSDFLGSDGLMTLLMFLHEKEFQDDEEVLQMIKRLHVRGYEYAFRHIAEAMAEAVFERNGPDLYISQSQIDTVIKWTEQRNAGA